MFSRERVPFILLLFHPLKRSQQGTVHGPHLACCLLVHPVSQDWVLHLSVFFFNRIFYGMWNSTKLKFVSIHKGLLGHSQAIPIGCVGAVTCGGRAEQLWGAVPTKPEVFPPGPSQAQLAKPCPQVLPLSPWCCHSPWREEEAVGNNSPLQIWLRRWHILQLEFRGPKLSHLATAGWSRGLSSAGRHTAETGYKGAPWCTEQCSLSHKMTSATRCRYSQLGAPSS